MKDKREEEFGQEFEAEFNEAWDDHRRTPQPFAPLPTWPERVSIVAIHGSKAIIKLMDDDGEIYTAEVPVSDLADIRDNQT